MLDDLLEELLSYAKPFQKVLDEVSFTYSSFLEKRSSVQDLVYAAQFVIVEDELEYSKDFFVPSKHQSLADEGKERTLGFEKTEKHVLGALQEIYIDQLFVDSI